MNEILKETKTIVVERQILVNQIAIMSCLKWSNFMYAEIFANNIEMSEKILESLGVYDNVLNGKKG